MREAFRSADGAVRQVRSLTPMEGSLSLPDGTVRRWRQVQRELDLERPEAVAAAQACRALRADEIGYARYRPTHERPQRLPRWTLGPAAGELL